MSILDRSNNTPNRFTDLKEPAGKHLYKKTYHSVTDITTFKPYFYKFRISLNLFLIRKKKRHSPIAFPITLLSLMNDWHSMQLESLRETTIIFLKSLRNLVKFYIFRKRRKKYSKKVMQNH